MGKKFFEKMAGAPAEVLEKTIDESKAIVHKIEEQKSIQSAKNYWKLLGPGLTTGAADDDPSGIATYSQSGAKYGFQLLWLAPLTFPLMAIVQEMCARIGIVTGRGLAANIKTHFPRWLLYLCTSLLFVANTLNIGADLGAMAAATKLLTPKIDFVILLIFFTVLTLVLQIFTTYEKYAHFLKWLAFILLSYVVTAFFIPNFDWSTLWKEAFHPSLSFSKEQIILICGIFGTTISPYLFFWQTSQEVEQEIEQGKTTIKLRQALTSDEEIRDMRLDVWSGMFLSNIVMLFIIAVTASTLHTSGIFDIQTAEQAALALKPLAGDAAFLLFAVGIIGVGLLAVPVLAGSASYALSESFGWKAGLHKKLRQAYAFYGVIILSVLIGLSINFLHLNPIKVLIYSAVANGLVAPVIIICIVMIANNSKIMGERVNHKVTKVLGWLIVALMLVVGLAAIYSMF